MGIRTFLLCALLSMFCYAEEPGSVLVLLDNFGQESQYTSFLKLLADRGFKISYGRSTDPDLSLTEFGVYKYNILLVLANSISEEVKGITAESILEFIDAGNNVFLASDENVGESVRGLAKECGVQFHLPGTKVIDHFHQSGSFISLNANNLISTPVIVGEKAYKNNILFSGIGHSVIDETNGLSFAILRGHETTYSSHQLLQDTESIVAGKKVTLVSALQARNNARVVVSGSLSLFSDTQTRGNSSNAQLIENLVQWFLNERGVLRISVVKDKLEGEGEKSFYTIKESVVYSAVIEEKVNGKWAPFKSDHVQFEFQMLDPYVRSHMKHDSKGNYQTSFQVPDTWGVYSFKLRLREKGYYQLDHTHIKSVRPFRHDSYPRFLLTASPYYAGSISMVAGVVLFSVAFLFSK